MSNKKAKDKLIKLYGAECFIEKLKLRKDTEPRRYTSKSQYKRMKQLTYHHIKERRNGGKATVENGALLSVENHEWFNKQSAEAQREMNRVFQEYKNTVECGVEIVDSLKTPLTVSTLIITPEELQKPHYNRAKEKAKWRKEIDEEEI